MGPKLQRLDWIWMYPKWIINVVVCFEFCLALPEVIHLPRGLEAVTRNWRNHDGTELSAPQSPGEESHGAHCSTKRWEYFPIWVFYAVFFLSLHFFPQYFSFFFPTPGIFGSGDIFNLMIRWPENRNLVRISHSVRNNEEKELSKKYLQSVLRSQTTIFSQCLQIKISCNGFHDLRPWI